MNQLVTTEWLDKNIEKVKILDASWHLPNANRNSFEEYKTADPIKIAADRILPESKMFDFGFAFKS